MKKLVSLLLAALLALTCLPAALAETELEPVTLRFYYPGTEKEGSKDVQEAFNKKLAEVLPNTTLEIVWVDSYGENLRLFFAGEEPMDIIWEGWYTPIRQDVEDGNIIALDELIDQYAPNLAAEKATYTIDYNSICVDGKLYGIPCVQPVVKDSWALNVNETLYPYFPVDDFIAEARANLKFTEKQVEMLEQTIQAALDDGAIELGGAWLPGGWELMHSIALKGYEALGGNFYYDLSAEKPTAIHITEMPEYQMAMKHVAEWYDKGWITDAQIMGQTVDGSWISFNLFGGNANWTDLVDERGVKNNTYAEQAEKAVLMDNEGTYPVGISTFGSAATYLAVPFTSKNPERVMMLLNLLHDEPGTVGNDLINMLAYGFEETSEEAKEYGWFNYRAAEVDGQLQVDTSVRGDAESKHGMTNWTIGNTYKIMSDGGVTTTAALKKYAASYYETVYPKRPRSVLADMPAIDLTELNTDVENINAVTTEYAEQIWNGGSGSESYMAVYNDYVSKLQAAGLETVRAYIQAQIDAHLAK